MVRVDDDCFPALLHLTLQRITLNSADYSVVSFNYDNITGDMDLTHFDDSLAYDNQRVIPLIRLANATSIAKGSGPLRLFASPWSPPGWMKTNNSKGIHVCKTPCHTPCVAPCADMINSVFPCLKGGPLSAYGETWANYIVRWLKAMRSQGIEFWGLTPQNEPLGEHFSNMAPNFKPHRPPPPFLMCSMPTEV